MNEAPLTLLFGFAAGFFGAIPPGPVNVTILRKTLHGHRGEALRVALGGAAVDTLICLLIGLGLGFTLESILTLRWVKGPLALFLIIYGLKILIWDQRGGPAATVRRAAAETSGEWPSSSGGRRFRLPFVVGFFQGAANPAVVVNWTLAIGFFVGHRLLRPGLATSGAFALGVGIGVFAWLALLIELLQKLRDTAGDWVRRSAAVAGVLLVLFGLFFTWRSFAIT